MGTRRKSKPALVRLNTVLLAAAVLTLLAMCGLGYRVYNQFVAAREVGFLVLEAQNSLADLLSSLRDTEIGQRGFLLTGEDRYLEPYNRAIERIPGELARVNAVFGRSAQGRETMARLELLVNEKLAELRQTIELRRQQGMAPALEVVLSDRGRKAMEEIRAIDQGIRNRLAAARTNDRPAILILARNALLVTTGGSVFLMLLLVAGYIAIDRGARAREQALAEMQSVRDSLRTTLASIGDAVIATDREGRVEFTNRVARSLLRTTEEELTGRHIHEVFRILDEETRKEVDDPVARVLREGSVVGLGNHTVLIAADGTEIPIDDSAAPIRDENGEIHGAVLVFRDITERRRADNSLRESARELETANQALRRSNEDLQRFAFVASHDLQEPLRMITTYAQLLVKRYPRGLDENAGMFVANIVEGTTRMRDLLSDLLAYTDIGSHPVEPADTVDLNVIMQDVQQNLEAAIQEAGAIISSDTLPTVRANAAHFTSLFQNLVANAIKYRGGQPPRIHVSVQESGGQLRFAVSDNGIGIDPQYYDRIFEPFKRLHGREVPGTGIGLAICQRVVERYGGRIWVESQAGEGSTFFFDLPDISVVSVGTHP